MSCSPFDLKDYFFDELKSAERQAVEAHASACPACREELTALQATRAALLSVAEEEPPRRIAFVSDKVFEPRWWQVLWNSGPKLGFAGAAMLSAAIVVHGFAARPSGEALEAEVAKRVSAEVTRAVAANEEQHSDNLLRIREYLERMEKRNSVLVHRAVYQ